MSNEEMVIVEIDEEGNPKISVKGVKGKGCKALTESLEKRLGVVATDVPTLEMNETEVTHGQSKQQRRNA